MSTNGNERRDVFLKMGHSGFESVGVRLFFLARSLGRVSKHRPGVLGFLHMGSFVMTVVVYLVSAAFSILSLNSVTLPTAAQARKKF